MTANGTWYFAERANAPDTPSASRWGIYFKSDGLYAIDDAGAETRIGPKHNFAATTAPGTGDDDADGYSIGSIWIDITGQDAYICEDASTGAANWLQINGGGSSDASAITYTPTVLTDWDADADPGNVDNALDQLAERVDDVETAGGSGASTALDNLASTAVNDHILPDSAGDTNLGSAALPWGIVFADHFAWGTSSIEIAAGVLDLSGETGGFITVEGQGGADDSLTSFSNAAYSGIRVLVGGGESITLVHNGSTIITPSGANVAISSNSPLLVYITSSDVCLVLGAYDNNALHRAVAGEILALTQKASPTGSDHLMIEDAAASNVKKRILISALALAASQITSGTLAHERGGLEADVSAFSGLVKISGGATTQAVAGTDYAAAGHNHDADYADIAHVHDAAVITYTPAVATDWDGDADPGDLDDALNQLAERVDDLEGAGGGGTAEIATGGYTGNGSATQAITGVGFLPDFVRVYKIGPAGFIAADKSDQDGANALLMNSTATTYTTDHIISLDADGFTVGDGTGSANQMNVNTATYAFVAMKA